VTTFWQVAPLIPLWIIGILMLINLAWRRSEERKAREYFDSLRGDAVDFNKVINRSGYFIACLISLEQRRINKLPVWVNK
jgi:hypothetical protein